jgi:hypothetical protein
VQQANTLAFIEKNFQVEKDNIDLAAQLQRICIENGIDISKDDKSILDQAF